MLVGFTTLQSRLFFPIGSMLQVSTEVHSSLALFDRIFEYLDLRHDIEDVPGATTLDPSAFRDGITVRMPIPEDAPPTVSADRVGVNYRIRALVDRPMRSDLAVERAIAIL